MESVCECWMSNGDILGNGKECKGTKQRASVLFASLCGQTGKRRTLFPWMPNRFGPSDQCDADSLRWVRRIQMPFSALSPSWETDRPLPSLLTAQPSLSPFCHSESLIGLISFFFFIFEGTLAVLLQSLTSAWFQYFQVTLWIKSPLTVSLAQQRWRGNAFKQFSPWMFTFTQNGSLNIVQTSIQCKENELLDCCAILIISQLQCQWCIILIVVCSCFFATCEI